MQTAAVQPESSKDSIHAFLQQLREQVGERNFRHWFEEKAVVSEGDGAIRISVASSFLQTWMQRRFGAEVSAAARMIECSIPVVWQVDAALKDQPRTATNKPDSAKCLAFDADGTAIGPANERLGGSESLDARSGNGIAGTAGANGAASSGTARRPAGGRSVERRTVTSNPHAAASVSPGEQGRRFASLDDFVVGKCNELALTAARHMSDTPASQFDSLYLHGPVGTGKTHLAEGIYRELRRQHPQMQVLFMTAEGFANQFTHALRSHSLPGFRQRFRNVHALIVDDVGFLDGKRVIQEEFLHTFNQLVSHHRPVVLTADSHPRLLTKLRDDLVTRLLSGMVCRLEAPDSETRRRIARVKGLAVGLDAAEEVLDFVARRFVHNVREIEGALNILRTWQSMTNRKVTLAVARQVLSELERDCIRIVRLADIQDAVCNLFGLTQEDLQSTGRTRKVSQPRMLAMYLARRHTQAAYKEIGEFFGGRNHSTVVAAEKKIEGWLRTSEEFVIGGRHWHLADVLETLEQQILVG